MNVRYRSEIDAARTLLSTAILAKEADLEDRALSVDALVRELLREVGRETVGHVWEELGARASKAAKAEGLGLHRRTQVQVMTLFGMLSVTSPYYRDARTKRSCRPLKQLGLQHGARSPAVERALTDFGAEESFGQAVRRFAEHYGFEVGRTTALRVVRMHAERAEAWVEERLDAARALYDEPLAQRPGVEQMLVELDGCEIRTGTLHLLDGNERTPVRDLPKRRREQAWVDVRVGFARPPNELERTYVARRDSYERVVNDLVGAACERGLSSATKVTAVADGGNGLSEELAAQFPGLRFVYDRPHLRSHLFETADAIGLTDTARREWVAHKVVLLSTGQVDAALAELEAHKGRGKARTRQLLKHLTRLREAFGYDEIQAAGLPIGSGEVESAHRTIPQKRMKLPGAWWHPDNLNSMLALRVVRANGHWDELWAQAS